MNEQVPPNVAGWLAAAAAKLLPAGLGALLIAAVDVPENRRELFLRVFVAMGCSILLGDIAIDYLASSFGFVNAAKHSHQAAVNGIVGAVGWFALGGVSQLLKKFRGDPTGTIKDLKS